MVNRPMNPKAYSIGVCHDTLPRHSVAVQLNTLMADGMATRKLRNEKISADVRRLAGDEHVVAPDQEAEDGDGDAGEGDEVVAEDHLLGERR